MRKRTLLLLFTQMAVFMLVPAKVAFTVELPDGYMPLLESSRMIEKTLTITLNPDLSSLTPAERGAAQKLLEAGIILQKLYESSLHHQARSSYESLVATDEALASPVDTQNLLKLFYLFKGPIARTLDNEFKPFLPVDGKVPGKNVYPWGISRDEIEKFLDEHPGRREDILNLRTVVRRAEKDAIQSDLATLENYPALDVLHPGLKNKLLALAKEGDENVLYAVPYSVAYANDIFRVYEILMDASRMVAKDDVDFSLYLKHRAVDLITDDYESGDASWVRGEFKHLNAQIGSYEVYDDELYAVKSFFSLSLLIRDEAKSSALRKAIKGIQSLEESLPYKAHKKVREDIPVGVYNVIADFGQARGINTATILPNESHLARKYGRTILIRNNILANPELFSIVMDSWSAATGGGHREDLTPEGNFYRTLWHEIGHYLGPSLDREGRTLSEALQEDSQVFEELKADLVSLFLARALAKRGYYDEKQLRSVYASGIRRVLLKNQPRREQTYRTMELMQFNYFLDKGILKVDPKSKLLTIDYDIYHDVVASMLEEVLSIQYDGDKEKADGFIDKYTSWKEDLHGTLAANMKAMEKYRYVIVRYGVLEQ